jgi:hypothetical protein
LDSPPPKDGKALALVSVEVPNKPPPLGVNENVEDANSPSLDVVAVNKDANAPFGDSLFSSFAKLVNPPKSDFVCDFGDDSSPAFAETGFDAKEDSPPNSPVAD